MQTITIYRYTRADGGVSTSPVKPDTTEYNVKYCLIADDGKALTDGATVTGCVDVDSADGWTEIDAPDDELSEDAAYAQAGKILLGGERMSIINRARKLRSVIEQMSSVLDDSAAFESPELFPSWREDIVYEAGQRVRHNGTLYKVLQEHTSQAYWMPDATPSLFAKVLIPDPEVIPEWEQPDSTNPYAKGNKMTHNGKTWVSDIDGNVLEPGVYGWIEITG